MSLQTVLDLLDKRSLLRLRVVGLKSGRRPWDSFIASVRQNVDHVRIMYETECLVEAHVQILKRSCRGCFDSLMAQEPAMCRVCLKHIPSFNKVTHNDAVRKLMVNPSSISNVTCITNPYNSNNGRMRLYVMSDLCGLVLAKFGTVEAFLARLQERHERSQAKRKRDAEIKMLMNKGGGYARIKRVQTSPNPVQKT